VVKKLEKEKPQHMSNSATTRRKKVKLQVLMLFALITILCLLRAKGGEENEDASSARS
jgi:hypothetical protein